VKVPEPSLGGVVVATPVGFASWFNNCDASPVIGTSLLLLRSPAMPADIYKSTLTEVGFQDAWHQRIEGLMDSWNPEAVPLRVCPPALERLFSYHNDISSQTARLPPDAQAVCCAPYSLATRLMIGLHLLSDASPQIANKTAATAVSLAQHYGARQCSVWLDAHAYILHMDPAARSNLVRLDVA